MPMDGLTLGFATREMNAILPGGRIDRITQPEKDTIVLLVRAGAANHRLLLCASPNNARCHFTNLNFPNPLEPPMFCMLLRKQILSGRILSIQQMHGDRVIHVDIDTVNELGDHVLRRLVLEIMGRHSNLMLLDEDGRILEAARHVSADMSRVRQIQPGLPYLPPPAQDKIAPEDADAENLLAKLEAQGDVPLQKALAASVSGLSNPAAKERAYRVLPAGCDRADNLPETAARLAELLRRLPQMADPRVLEDEQGEPADIFPFPYLSCDLDRQKPYPTVSQALERYFGARDQQDRINQKSASMVKLLKGQIERCEKKLAQQEEDLSSAARMDEYRIMGEIINANLWQLKKGQTEATLPNFYDENGGSMTIPLDNQEGTLLDVGKCIGESELEEIRQDLMRTGYIRKGVNRRQQKALPKSKPYHYRSTDGIDIYVGKNAAQNDRLTGDARPNETWLHAKDMPGSHVIIRQEGEIPRQTLLEAAILAAWYSKGQNSSGVPIDYTLRRFVKKPGGAAPGMVIYTNQRTLFMTISESDVRKIQLVEE